MHVFPISIYLLCCVTSCVCLALLIRGYLRTRVKLLFWCAICFVCLALNNFLLFLDYAVLPDIDLRPYRTATMVMALAVLIYGFIWKVE